MPHVLWIGVGHAHPHLFQLHKRVNEAALACNLPIEERAWTPHFTIARGRGISAALMQSFLKKHRDFDAGMFHVVEFHLYESTLTPAGPDPPAASLTESIARQLGRYSMLLRRHQNAVAHSVDQFLVRRHNCGQGAAQFYPIVFHKIIRTQPHPAFHRSHFAGFAVVIRMLEQACPCGIAA